MKRSNPYLIAIVGSFSDGDAFYPIFRFGKKVKNGGRGVSWECSCPHFVNRRPSFMGDKHLRTLALWAKGKIPWPDGVHLHITPFGAEILGPIAQAQLTKQRDEDAQILFMAVGA